MSLSEITVKVERPFRTGDGSGGKAIGWVTVPGMAKLKATRNYYGRTSQLLRMEQAAHNAQGPGVGTRKDQLFVFRDPTLDIRINDRIVAADGVPCVVQWPPRVYDDELQVDTEVVQ